ncbi:MAG: hypothetical protein MZV64_06515 [Ignavibacteriales bacterium]|nr:hypothetical protein [Ignavibacteriales bacterium]
MKKVLVLIFLVLPFLFLANLQAQQWSAEQKEVWKTIDAQWQADKDGKNWVEEFLHPDCIWLEYECTNAAQQRCHKSLVQCISTFFKNC